VFAKEWVSPIDQKYAAKNSLLFATFSEAREILDSWSGQGKKLIEADVLLKSVLEADSNYAPAYREYGRLFTMAGVIDEDSYSQNSLELAEASILKAIEIEPKYADAFVLLGHVYTVMKQDNAAKKALVKAQKIGTKIPWLPLNWAALYAKQKQYKKAQHYYELALKAGGLNKKAYLSALDGVINTSMQTLQYDKANAAYQKQIAYDETQAWNWGNYSSFLLFNYNDVDAAIFNGQKAISLMDYGMARFTLACAFYTKWAQLLQGNHDIAAKQYFDKAWALYPYPERVIQMTRNYKATEVTAKELQKWLDNRPVKTPYYQLSIG
jgi:tetratricopeptide (TPR) repeat protein